VGYGDSCVLRIGKLKLNVAPSGEGEVGFKREPSHGSGHAPWPYWELENRGSGLGLVLGVGRFIYGIVVKKCSS
jgi:hypothetical protein